LLLLVQYVRLQPPPPPPTTHTHTHTAGLHAPPSQPPLPRPPSFAAHCYCNSTFPHGRIPADPSDPPGTPPKRRGRPIAHLCRRGYVSRPC
jgi:hypothetical protein